MTIAVISREELYEKVWALPMAKLAPEFGVSDRALAKICIRNSIPYPGLGYWRKLEVGEKVKKIALPKLEFSPPIRIGVNSRPKVLPQTEIQVPETLHSPHFWIKQTKQNLSHNKKCHWNERRTDILDIRVSKGALPRALRILDTLIKEIEKAGGKVFVERERETVARFGGEDIRFHIEERSKVERKERRAGDPSSGYEQEYLPTGALSLIIDSWTDSYRGIFRDGKKQTVEGLLPEFLATLLLVRDSHKRRTEKWDNEKKESERREAIRREENDKIDLLRRSVLAFENTRRVGRYLRALQKRNPANESQEYIEWREWVERFYSKLKEGSVHFDLSALGSVDH